MSRLVHSTVDTPAGPVEFWGHRLLQSSCPLVSYDPLTRDFRMGELATTRGPEHAIG